MITIRNLTYSYPGQQAPALQGVSLTVAAGEFVLVVGASGAGKSTLLRCINGLVPHFSGGVIAGSVHVADVDVLRAGPRALSQTVGFVFQNPAAQSVVDIVEAEVAFALENAGLPPAEMRVRVEEMLDLLDLARLRNRSVSTLSGGELQRVAIAAAMALRPPVLVLDEPTSQLDPQAAEELLQALVRLNEDLGLTVVLAEHRLERVLRYADRLVYLPGPPLALVDAPPRQALARIPLQPPLARLGLALGWQPLPLTVKEGIPFARVTLGRRPGDQETGRPETGDRRRHTLLANTHRSLGPHHPAARTAPTAQASLGHGHVGGRNGHTEGHNGHAAAPRAALLEVENLWFSRGRQEVLRGAGLRVAPGEAVALMGRNGSGKTTLLRCLVGLLRPVRGSIVVMGRSTEGRSVAEICRQVAYLPQDPDDLLFAETVAEELEMTLRNHGIDPATAASAELLRRLGLHDVAQAYPRDLSVGQRQRVALGAVTITAPPLLLMDEPTRGLDYAAKQALIELWQGWLAAGAGLLLVTHDVELAAQVADRVVVLSQGQVIADGPAAEVMAASPLFSPQVARLFPGMGWLTVEDALEGLGRAQAVAS